jgi:hypothetical protein
LEDRSVPAAATAVFTAVNGTLTITGATVPEPIDDNLSVQLIAGKVAVLENNTTSIPITDGINPTALSVTLLTLKSIVVNAGDGDDTIFISPVFIKPATINGGLGEDVLTGGSGNDQINGEDGIDFLFGGKGNDTITGGTGDGQTIDGQVGNDLLTGGAEVDDIFGGFGNDSINGGGGDDRLRGDDPTDKIGGKDTIHGEDGDDIILSGRGNDIITGGDGNDLIEAGDGNDTVTGGDDDDGPDLDADADSIYGGTGNDSLGGGWGRDLIYGEVGNDVLLGGAGEDILSGGFGIDSFTGHGTNVGDALDVNNFDTYRDEFDLSRPINIRAEVKDIAVTELGIQAALGGIAAVANNQTNFKIASRIRYLGSGEYLVKLGLDEDISSIGGWVPVQFNGTWTDNDPRPSAQERFLPKRDAREFWTILVHRAVAQSLTGTYDPFVHYDQATYEGLHTSLTNSSDFIGELTGVLPGTPIALPGGFSFIDLKASLPLGAWFTAQAVPPVTPLAGIAENQFYAVTRVFTVLGVNYITLYNASGFDHGVAATPTNTLDQFGKPVDDGFITLKESDFLANFATLYRNN